MTELEDLLKKEIDLSEEMQLYLEKRIRLMKESLQDLSSTDPAFFTLQYQIEADLVSLDELKRRREELITRARAQ